MHAPISSRGPRTAAFTLIELLTVIAIIAILMALLLTGITGAKEQVRRSAAKAALIEILGACTSYQNDYGKFPPVDAALIGDVNTNGLYAYGDTGEGKCAVTNDSLFDILRAIDRGVNKDHAMNRRRQSYLTAKVATGGANPRDGFCDGNEFPSTQGRFMDPWGGQYCVVLSASVSLDMSRFYSDLSGPMGVLHVPAAGFAMGKDGKRGGTGYEGRYQKPNSSEAADDIVSWR